MNTAVWHASRQIICQGQSVKVLILKLSIDPQPHCYMSILLQGFRLLTVSETPLDYR